MMSIGFQVTQRHQGTKNEVTLVTFEDSSGLWDEEGYEITPQELSHFFEEEIGSRFKFVASMFLSTFGSPILIDCNRLVFSNDTVEIHGYVDRDYVQLMVNEALAMMERMRQ